MKNRRWNNPLVIMPVLWILWGSWAAGNKLALQTLDGFQVLFYTFSSALLIFTVLFLLTGRMKALFSLGFPHAFKLLSLGIPYYLYYLLYNLALARIPVVEVSMLNYLFPILIVMLSIPIFGEKLTSMKGIAIAASFIGMLLIISGGRLSDIRFSDLGGDLLAVGAALSWAVFSVLGKKNRVDEDLAVYLYTVSAFLFSVAGMFGFSGFNIPDLASVGMTLWLAVSNIVVGNLLWFRGLKSSSASLIASLSYLTPFVTLLFIVVLLGETVSAGQLAGVLVILAGVALQWVSERPHKAVTSLVD